MVHKLEYIVDFLPRSVKNYKSAPAIWLNVFWQVSPWPHTFCKLWNRLLAFDYYSWENLYGSF